MYGLEINITYKLKKIVDGFKVVNGTAERGIKLIQDFNSCLTKDEEQQQFLLQLVSECRKFFPDSSKATLSEPFLILHSSENL